MKIAYLLTDPGIPAKGGKGASVHVRAITSALAGLGHEVRVLAAHTGGTDRWDPRVTLEALGDIDRVRKRWRRLRRVLRSGAAEAGSTGSGPPTVGSTEARLMEMLKLELVGRAAVQGRRRLEAHPPDIILERLSPFGAAGVIISEQLSIPRVVEMNSPLTEESLRWRRLEFPEIAQAIERAALCSAAGVMVVSRALARRCRMLGVPPKKILLLPNGVDPDLFRPGTGDPRLAGELGLGKAPVVGFTGSLKLWHGVDLLIEAFARIPARNGGPRLLVVGDGPERPRLEEQAAARGIDRRVVFTGPVPHARVPEYTRLMDVAAAPYRADGDFYFSPLKVVEYLACGIPVVASGEGDIARLVTPGRTGCLVPAGDTESLAAALERLLGDPDLRRELGRAGRSLAERHSWEGKASRAAAFLEGTRDGG